MRKQKINFAELTPKQEEVVKTPKVKENGEVQNEKAVKNPKETKDKTPKPDTPSKELKTPNKDVKVKAKNTPGKTPKMVIKETKNWILRCYGCFYTTPVMSKVFCSRCGNKTLKRVSVTVNSDGSQELHISTRRPISKRGKKFSLPAPKGGKHAVNPRLFEDQRDAQQRISAKALARTNPMGEDYMAGSSPFVTKDITSKSAMLGLHGSGKGNAQVPGMYWARKNPNQVKKNTGNGKKK